MTRYRVLSQPGGLTRKDICVLLGCAKTTGLNIINAIHEKIAATPGSLLPIQGVVSRQSFCEHMGWDFNEIQSFALLEMAAMSRHSNIHTNQGGYM